MGVWTPVNGLQQWGSGGGPWADGGGWTMGGALGGRMGGCLAGDY